MVSCSGVFLPSIGGVSVKIIVYFPGVPRRHEQCWVGVDIQRQISVTIRGADSVIVGTGNSLITCEIKRPRIRGVLQS